METDKTCFCMKCREETTYHLNPIAYKKRIRDKEYAFEISEAVCDKCGASVNIPGLMDFNAQEIDRQYRVQENIVSVKDIHNLMGAFNIDKGPLPLSLGFEENTITRYLAGQVPPKEHSNIIRSALEECQSWLSAGRTIQ